VHWYKKIKLIGVFSRHIQINSLEDINKPSIGGIREDASVQLLLERGIPKKNIHQVAKTRINIDKFNMGRIDVWANSDNGAMWELKSNGFNPADYELVFILDDKYDLCFAISKKT